MSLKSVKALLLAALLQLFLLLKRSVFFPIFLSPQTIKHLRTAEFKPFVVFVKPPSIERLRETRQNGKVVSGKDDKDLAKPFTVRRTSLEDKLQTRPRSQMRWVCLDLNSGRKSELSICEVLIRLD